MTFVKILEMFAAEQMNNKVKVIHQKDQILIQVIPAALSTLIMVNAADLVGRKRLFIFPLFGYIVYNVSFLCNWFLSGSSW